MKKISLAILCFVLVLGFPFSAGAAVLYLSPESQNLSQGATFVSELWIDTEGEDVNAVFAHISYPVNVLEVVELNTGGSAFSLFPQDPTYSNDVGTLVLQAGTASSLEGRGLIGRVFFRAKQTGEATVQFAEESSVLLNDGFGTRTNVERKSALYTVSKKTGTTLRIVSKQYPSENLWFQADSVAFTWNVREGARYSYKLSFNPVDLPDEAIDEASGAKTYTLSEDGIYYFHIRECLGGECGSPITRRIMRDTVAPEPFEIRVGQQEDAFEGKQFLAFVAIDTTSGVDHYELLRIVDGTEESWKIVKSPYVLEDDIANRMVQVKAVDKAGNERIASFLVENNETVYKNYLLFGIIIGIGICALYVILWLRKLVLKKRQKHNIMH